MDDFSAAEAVLNKTGYQHEAAGNQEKIEQLKDCGLYALHVGGRYALDYQPDVRCWRKAAGA
jgi:hypothetical protein